MATPNGSDTIIGRLALKFSNPYYQENMVGKHDVMVGRMVLYSNGAILLFHRLQEKMARHAMVKSLRNELDCCLYRRDGQDRKSTRLNSSHVRISYAVFCLKK